MLYFLALLIGIIAGLRAMIAPAAIAFAAQHGLLNLSGTWLAFLGYRWTPWIFLVLAIGELVTGPAPHDTQSQGPRAIRDAYSDGRPERRCHRRRGGVAVDRRDRRRHRRNHRDTGRQRCQSENGSGVWTGPAGSVD